MIDIDKFEQLANEIIANATKDKMEKWLNDYRANEVTFVCFQPIEGKFKMDFSKLNFNKNEPQFPLNEYSWAA